MEPFHALIKLKHFTAEGTAGLVKDGVVWLGLEIGLVEVPDKF